MSAIRLAPSILAADFARLGEQVRDAAAAGADRIHIDVMDGHFVPNISMGPLVVKALRPVTTLPLEAHLMISRPERYVEAFAKAGADTILVHVEEATDLGSTVAKIRDLGKRVGVVVNPATPAEEVGPYLDRVDMVLVMTVVPGFGGQPFMRETLPKIARVREMIAASGRPIELETDGGIDVHTAPEAVRAGSDVLVCGSSVFGPAAGVAAAMDALRKAVG